MKNYRLKARLKREGIAVLVYAVGGLIEFNGDTVYGYWWTNSTGRVLVSDYVHVSLNLAEAKHALISYAGRYGYTVESSWKSLKNEECKP